MSNINQKIRREATSVLLRIILFLVYYYSLVLVGIGLFALAGWATWNILDFFLGLNVFNVRLVIVVGLALAAIWLFCFQIGMYLIRPIFGIESNNQEVVKPEVTEEECPELFAMIGKIANATGNKMPKHVYLCSEVNAYVSYDSPSIWSVFVPSRKNLTLGIGLLYGMNKSELKAIVSHEYGHFSQKTMRIGTLTYRLLLVIQNIIEYTEENQKEEAIARTSPNYKWYFHLAAFPIRYITGRTIAFYKYIEKKNRSLSRLMEYEADNIACQIAGANSHISALCKLDVLSSRYNLFENVLQSLLSEGHYLEDFLTGYQYCFGLLAEDESIHLSNTDILTASIGTNASFPSRIKVIDGWNTHPTIEERIANAKLQKSNHSAIDTASAGELISNKITNSVGLSRQKDIVLDLNLQYGWNSVKPMTIDDFKTWLLDKFKRHRIPNYIYPFLNNTIVAFEIPADKDLEKEEIESPFTEENRSMLLEFAQADRDWDTLDNIRQSNEEVHFSYNGKENIELSAAVELHKAYISSFNPLIHDLDIKIYKYLWKCTENKKRLKNMYWLLFFSNAGLYGLRQIHDATEDIFSTLQFYKDNGVNVSINNDYLRQISVEFRKFMGGFDFDNISILCGDWSVDKEKNVDSWLKEWQEYLTTDSSSSDGTIYKVQEVWSLLVRLYNFTNGERKQRAVCAYRGENFKENEINE